MKTKNKLFALVEIVIVLCSLFLVALPSIAADQTTQKISTTASEDDYVLGVYGNANEDDTIDMRDLTYVKLIFFGKKPETELADAKYDGKINPLDFIQIKLIIVGKEKELTVVDTAGRIVTVSLPLKKIVVFNNGIVETMRSLKLEKNRIAGIDKYTIANKIFYSEFQDSPNVGSTHDPDLEKVLSLHPDAVFSFAVSWAYGDLPNKLEALGLTAPVICFDCYQLNAYMEEVKKLGYLLGKKEEADEFLEFYTGWLNTISERVKKIPADERPKVYYETNKPYQTCGEGIDYDLTLVAAGGVNIFSYLKGYRDLDPEEVVMRNPEIIVRGTSGYIEGYDVDNPTELKNVRDEIMGRPELQNVPAVKNGRVYILGWTVGSGTRDFVGIGYMAKWFYPELFADMDPKAIHQEYLTRFQGLDYDLDKHGVFVYPEPS